MGKKKKKGKKPSKFAYIKYRKEMISKGEIPLDYNAWVEKQVFK
jgi:hypothetical protein